MHNRISRFAGWFILILFGLPSLIGVIWAVGVVRGVFSTQLMRTIPQQLLTQAPQLIQLALDEAQKPGAVKDENAAKWFKAANNTQMNIGEVLDQSGLSKWLEEDVSEVVGEMELMLRGEKELKPVEVNLMPFKEAASGPIIENYLKEMVSNLDQCSQEETGVWIEELRTEGEKNLPACDPGVRITNQIWNELATQVKNLPDSNLLNDGVPRGTRTTVNVLGIIEGWMWLLFLLPVSAILLGVWLTGKGRGKCLRDGGLVAVTGGILTYLSAMGAKSASHAATAVNNWGFNYDPASPFSYDFYSTIANRMGEAIMPFVKNLFDPVINIAVIVTVLGAILAIAGKDLVQKEIRRT